MGQQRGHDDRAQSAPLAVVLVLSIVITGSVLVVALGSESLSATESRLDTDRAEQGLTQFDSQTAMVALGEAGTQEIALPSGSDSGYRVDEDAGWMRVTVTNATDGSRTTVMNVTLGAVVFENGGTTVAYQGGGVWLGSDGGGTKMVSPPEFHYRGATLTLPLVTVTGDPSLSGSVTVTRSGPRQQFFPDPATNSDWVNPLDSGRVTVTVHSDYYPAWGRFFGDRTDGTAAIDHANETATTRLVVPTGPRTVSNAVAATSAGGTIKLAGSGGGGSNTSRTDSYNSSAGNGTYADTKTANGTVRTAGDVTVKGNSEVNGNVRSGGFVTVKGSGVVTGDVYYTDGTKISGGTVQGKTTQISGVEGVPAVDGYVARRYGDINSTNDNGGVPISGNTLDSGDQTLGPGDYHLDRLVLDGETLTLDTGTDEEVEIAVKEYVKLQDNAEIKIEGTGEVRFYVDGQATTGSGDYHFKIDGSGGIVNVTDAQNARQFWIYGRSDFQATIDGTSGNTHVFEGVFYAPAGPTGSSTVSIEKGDIYGGVVAGNVYMENGGSVHYDRSLTTVRAVPPDQNIVRLTYLHISVNPVEVSDS